MEKVKVTKPIQYEFTWSQEVVISEIRADLDAVEALGATHIVIEHTIRYGDSYLEITAVCERIETDPEYDKRLQFQERLYQLNKQRDLDLLAKLKNKYEQ